MGDAGAFAGGVFGDAAGFAGGVAAGTTGNTVGFAGVAVFIGDELLGGVCCVLFVDQRPLHKCDTPE